jgi:hypothetical protein
MVASIIDMTMTAPPDLSPVIDMLPIDYDAGLPSGPNIVPMIVDGQFSGFNVGFISITLCVPGTTTCQTIDHVAVDTGSSGMRIISTVLSGSLALPQVKASTGDPLAECSQFADGYTWGSVRNADVKVGGEIAANIPIQVIGDPAFPNVPSDCSSSGPNESTLDAFGYNGLIGINQLIPDCGDYCTVSDPSQSPPEPSGYYYSCTSGTCTDVVIANAAQVSNPIAFFAQDDNGAILQFPSVPATGAATLAGSLIFGIGTQSNNGLGSAKVLTVDNVYAQFTTTFNGATFNTSYIDSGTTVLSFNDSSIPACADDMNFDCPTSTLSLMATNTGLNMVSSTVSFTVANADTLFATNNAALDDLGSPGEDANTFVFGFPFFIGRSVYTALDGKSTPGGDGPYVAY